ncbi:glycosyltransferase family 4 protein [Teredinibacter haidensis]|uniref:glycosyltransferase family 4 protein n=1 Tax=Teredinibacter haidensis TaxID=2731755 RepID=UPI000948F1AF|nr:glycosyltransferase family 4 protein [Teredinibacter haidensis]
MDDRKEKILVLTSTYPRFRGDSIPEFVHGLSSRLNNKYDFFVLAPHCKRSLKNEVIDGVNIVRFRYAPERLEVLAYGAGMLAELKRNRFVYLLVIPFLFSQMAYTCFFIWKYKIRLVHCHWIIPQGITVLFVRLIFWRKVKVVLTVHGGDLYSFNGAFGRLLKRVVLSAADIIAAVSEAVKADINSRFPGHSQRCVVAPMGVDLEGRFIPGAVKHRQGIGFVGRLVEKKGVSTLINSLRILHDMGGNQKLTIIGDGDERPQLESLVQELGLQEYVEFLGAIPNERVVGYYQKVEVAVIPSLVASTGDREGLGLVAVEAIGSGAITVASDLPALADVITDGVTGYTFGAGCAESLAEKLHNIFSDIEGARRQLDCARDHIVQKFSWGSSAERYAEIFKSALVDKEKPTDY